MAKNGHGTKVRGHGKKTERGGRTMWNYLKKLQYPIKIKNANPKLAAYIISQYGGAYQNVRVALLTPPKYAF